MSTVTFAIAKEALDIALDSFFLSRSITQEERTAAPALLKEYVDNAITQGAQNAEVAGFAAVGQLRQRNQIRRSQQRLQGGANPNGTSLAA